MAKSVTAELPSGQAMIEAKAEIKKAKKPKAPERTKFPFMGEEAYEEAVRVWNAEFVPTLSDEQTRLLLELSVFMRDSIGWKAFGRLVGTGDPKKS